MVTKGLRKPQTLASGLVLSDALSRIIHMQISENDNKTYTVQYVVHVFVSESAYDEGLPAQHIGEHSCVATFPFDIQHCYDDMALNIPDYRGAIEV